ncbi:MAG: hypothetical protein Q9191_004615 [Dirinaria sp. TL-2023a]
MFMDDWAFVRLVRATPIVLSHIARKVSSLALALAEALYTSRSNVDKLGYKTAIATAAGEGTERNHQDVQNHRQLGTNSVHTTHGTSIAATAPTDLSYFKNGTSERLTPSPRLHSQVCQIPLAPLSITQAPNIYRDPFFPPTSPSTPPLERGDFFRVEPSERNSVVLPTTSKPPSFPPSPRESPASDGETSICICSSLPPTSSPECSDPFHIRRSDSDSMVAPTTPGSPRFPQSLRKSLVSDGETSICIHSSLLPTSAPERSESFPMELSDGDLVVSPTTSSTPQSSRQSYVSDKEQSAAITINLQTIARFQPNPSIIELVHRVL